MEQEPAIPSALSAELLQAEQRIAPMPEGIVRIDTKSVELQPAPLEPTPARPHRQGTPIIRQSPVVRTESGQEFVILPGPVATVPEAPQRPRKPSTSKHQDSPES